MLITIISFFLAIDILGFHQELSVKTESKAEEQGQQVKTERTNSIQTEQQTMADQQDETSDTGSKLELAVISDTHMVSGNQGTADKFRAALKDLNTAAPNYDVLAVVGDMTEHGLPEEYDLFKTFLKADMNQNADTFMVMGNHEWMEKTVYRNSTVTDIQLIERFKTKMNVPGLYYDEWIQGYHFITIAGEKSYTTMLADTKNPSDIASAYISDEQFQWLENTLAQDARSNKPIFVFLHQPITGTVYGSEWGAGLEDQKLLSLLKKYPQVILFSGHSHYPLNNQNSIVQDGIIMVNTSAVAYTYTPKNGENKVQSQGYVINVYNNRVEFKAREFSTGTWIKTVTIPIYKP